jgi:creatinine amidohydrolase
MSFSGTISTSVETYLAMAFEILGSIAQAGFRTILVINSHGGNVSVLDLVLTKCREAYPKTRIVGVTYWNAAAAQLRELRESPIGGMGHACELETSLVLATRPDLVRKDHLAPDGRQAVSEFSGTDMLHGGSVTISRHFSEISRSGAVGDPSTATAEKGERFFEVIISRLAKLVSEIESGRIDEFRAIGE